jgi:uncharacterized DUF497 family protein
MKSISFVWDSRKHQSNIRKHGVSFDEAKSVFYDEMAVLFFDEDHSDSEERYIMPGTSEKLRILIVCHCTIEENKIIRIISARKATKNESRYYKGK